MYVTKENINTHDNKQNMLRKCYKFFNLKSITNILTKKLENNRIKINIVFSMGTDLEKLEYKTKTFNFLLEKGKKFIQILNFYLSKLNIDIKFSNTI